jgi:hypothetical protein
MLCLSRFPLYILSRISCAVSFRAFLAFNLFRLTSFPALHPFPPYILSRPSRSFLPTIIPYMPRSNLQKRRIDLFSCFASCRPYPALGLYRLTSFHAFPAVISFPALHPFPSFSRYFHFLPYFFSC